MQKILYIWKSEYPWDVRVEKICNSLSESNYEVTILSRWRKGLPQHSEIENVDVIRAGYKKPEAFLTPFPWNPFWKKEVRNAIVNIKPDLIIVREIILAELVAKEAKKHNIPVVMDMAENYPAAMKLWKKYRSSFFRRLYVHKFNIPELVEKRSVPLMDGIITVCYEQNLRLILRYNYPEKKLISVHNTPLIDNIIKSKVGCSRPPIVFGHHGFMSAEKGLDSLLEAFAIASKKEDDIRLFLAGTGECFDDLVKKAAKLGIQSKVIFHGQYSNTEITNILNKIDIGVIPYTPNNFNNYTIHNKIFEYMACGKPIIVSETEPFKRIIDEYPAGLVIDCTDPEKLAEAMLKIRNLDLTRFSINGLRAFYWKYNWTNDSVNMIRYIRKIIKHG